MEKEDPIYNAIIIACVIGIVITIAVLITTKVGPENFTELYFENHKELPKYAEQGKGYDFSFAIHNLENRNMDYGYRIESERFRINEICEKATLYLEKTDEESVYPLIAKGFGFDEFYEDYGLSEFTKSYAESPAEIINWDDYLFGFGYITYSGARRVRAFFKGIDNEEKYSLLIDESNKEAFFLRPSEKGVAITRGKIDIEEGIYHNVRINASKDSIKTYIDNKLILDINDVKEHTKGKIGLESTNTYADFSNVKVTSGDKERYYGIVGRAIRWEDVKLEKKESNKESLYSKINKWMKLNRTVSNISSVTTYYNDSEKINFMNYYIDFSYTTSEGYTAISLKDSYTLLIHEPTNEGFFLRETKKGLKITRKKIDIGKGRHGIKIDVDQNNVRVYFDSKLIFELDDVERFTNSSLAIEETNATLGGINLRSLEEPYTSVSYSYPIEEGVEYIKLPSYVPKEMGEEKINWTTYTFNFDYTTTNKSKVKASFKDYEKTKYKLSIEEESNKTEFTRIVEGEEKTETTSIQTEEIEEHDVSIDVEEETVKVYVDNKLIFNLTDVEEFTGGTVQMESEKGTKYSNIIVTSKDPESPGKKVFLVEEEQCEPIKLGKELLYNSSVRVWDKQTNIIEEGFNISEDFDYAKISVYLKPEGKDEQEIHFWVNRI